MNTHVVNTRQLMFRAATARARNSLDAMLDNLQSEVEASVNGIVAMIENDYLSLVADRNIFKALASARDEVRDILAKADSRFEKVVRHQAPDQGLQISSDMAAISAGNEIFASASAYAALAAASAPVVGGSSDDIALGIL
jgi:hypothetical protein